jgi:hypothetical protein
MCWSGESRQYADFSLKECSYTVIECNRFVIATDKKPIRNHLHVNNWYGLKNS